MENETQPNELKRTSENLNTDESTDLKRNSVPNTNNQPSQETSQTNTSSILSTNFDTTNTQLNLQATQTQTQTQPNTITTTNLNTNTTQQNNPNEQQNAKLYVGNIDFSIPQQTIRGIFETVGQIANIHMPYDHQNNRHKGFCFIEFTNPNSVNLAFEKMAGYQLAGREFKLGRSLRNQSSGRGGQYQNQNQTQQTQSNPNCKLYVGNVAWTLTEEDLIGVFSSFGPVKSIKLMKDPNSTQHKGFGFVDFMSPQSAQLALSSMNGFSIGGRNIKVGLPTRSSGGSQNRLNTLVQQQQQNLFGFNPMLQTNTNPMFGYGNLMGNIGALSGVYPNLQNTALNLNSTTSTTTTQTNNINNNQNQQTRSRCLVVMNMILSEQEIDEELKKKVGEELELHGSVIQIFLQIGEVNEGVKVYVKYASFEESKNAKIQMSNRLFNGRKMKADYYSEEDFKNNKF
ncbi:poly(u)-binding-splicing factor puf60-b-related [Anaeramoeba flamelloides]|uniref:Poly(U)-binding-splicing factor puf60-b-related n=1 Tax=Anaeramoeba flamelloides TaxID=1746091 RepID=A0AAV7YLF0_9EUKA|nr:poly(u)-binding-splicing factor puf60-b-related [Anaeramoeba flamelloides]